MPRMRRQGSNLPVPQDATEADAFVGRIGEAQRELALIQAALDEAIAAAKKAAEDRAAPHAAAVERLTAGLQTWAEANRARLTEDGRTKTVRMPSGEIAWRIRPPSVSLSNVAALVEYLRGAKGLARFLRTKHEPDKEAMLREPELARGLPGVTVKTGIEDFVVTPTAVALAADGRAAA